MLRRTLLISLLLTSAPLFAQDSALKGLAGFWQPKFDREPFGQVLLDLLPEGTLLINDGGDSELAPGQFAGLRLTPRALAEAAQYDPNAMQRADAACIPPTVAFYMQAPFPFEIDEGRDLIVFLTFAVILATLVGQGLTLPLLIRTLGLRDDGHEAREDAKARIHAAEAALARLEELVEEDWVREDTAERVRGSYTFRTTRFRARLDDGDDGSIESRSQDYQRLRRELLDAERQALVELRRSGAISNDVWIRVGRDLDLEDQRLDI